MRNTTTKTQNLEAEYLALVIKDCEDYYRDLRKWLAEIESWLLY